MWTGEAAGTGRSCGTGSLTEEEEEARWDATDGTRVDGQRNSPLLQQNNVSRFIHSLLIPPLLFVLRSGCLPVDRCAAGASASLSPRLTCNSRDIPPRCRKSRCRKRGCAPEAWTCGPDRWTRGGGADCWWVLLSYETRCQGDRRRAASPHVISRARPRGSAGRVPETRVNPEFSLSGCQCYIISFYDLLLDTNWFTKPRRVITVWSITQEVWFSFFIKRHPINNCLIILNCACWN